MWLPKCFWYRVEYLVDGDLCDEKPSAMLRVLSRRSNTMKITVLLCRILLCVSGLFCAQVSAQEALGKLPNGSLFRDCAECPQMVIIPAGSFLMGSPQSEALRERNEGPQHRGKIGAAFAVGRYEITFDEWDACVAAGGCNGYQPFDYHWGRKNRPVVEVSWDDTQVYLRWLNRKTGQHYRLLTESEWEYAARAGSATRYSWGEQLGQNLANCKNCGSQWDGKQTAPVGSFAANAFGLYDMLGNVWEWVADGYHPSYRHAPKEGRVWRGGEDMRVLRGGAWSNEGDELRAARRDASAPDGRGENGGFRVARDLN
jgi:formylglycine-generating enzyme required for sulfatase activity